MSLLPCTAGASVTIQRLCSDDWQIWRALRLAALADAPEAFGARLSNFLGTSDSEQRWRARLSALPLNLAVRIDDRWLAMASAGLAVANGVELFSMWIAPAARGHGVSTLLLAEVAGWAVAQGAARVQLRLHGSNAYALAMYTRHGFTPARHIKRRSRGRQDCLVLVRMAVV